MVTVISVITLGFFFGKSRLSLEDRQVENNERLCGVFGEVYGGQLCREILEKRLSYNGTVLRVFIFDPCGLAPFLVRLTK